MAAGVSETEGEAEEERPGGLGALTTLTSQHSSSAWCPEEPPETEAWGQPGGRCAEVGPGSGTESGAQNRQQGTQSRVGETGLYRRRWVVPGGMKRGWPERGRLKP